MYMIGILILCSIMSFFMYMLVIVFPPFRIVYFDLIAIFVALIPSFIILYRMKATSHTYEQTDKQPPGRQIVNYLRPSDRKIIPTTGERAFPGLPFIQTSIGIIEMMGGESVYDWGDKKVTWAIEGVDYTPDPNHFTFTALLTQLGFKNSDDVVDVFNGKNPTLMAHAYMKMEEIEKNSGASKLVDMMKKYKGGKMDFVGKNDKKPVISTVRDDKKFRLIERDKEKVKEKTIEKDVSSVEKEVDSLFGNRIKRF